MSLFGKKKEDAKPCCCGGNCSKEDMLKAESLKADGDGIKILGSGCPKCNALEAAVKAAISLLGINEEIDHVRDFSQIAAYGVMTTPALVVDGKVVSYGKVLKPAEAAELIRKARS